MEKLEQKNIPQETPAKETEQERQARLILRYIETKIVRANKSIGANKEKEIKKHYAARSPQEKGDALYFKIMAYILEKKASQEAERNAKNKGEKFVPETIDPGLISEIKILSEDKNVRALLPTTFGEARIDAKQLRSSEIGKLWRETNKEITKKEGEYRELGQKLHLNKISGETKISFAESEMEMLVEGLTVLEELKNKLETLQGLPKTAENTDAVAQFQYENLKEYKKQLNEGFVWLPSRKKIHQKTINAILNYRWPVLIGEAGSGKSDQADAAAIELTGHPPTDVACSTKTGEKDLVKDLAIASQTGESYEVYGPLMQAMTGYEDSRQEKPTYGTGRICRFDEAYRIPHDSPGYSIIKKARQLKPGDRFYGKPVLPGSGAIWTTNLPGPRYPERYPPDPALRRELAEVRVDYPEMSNEKPELYEFALTTLLDENNHIRAAKKELAPAYEKKEIPEDQRRVLEDGSIIVAEDKIIENIADARHGALWRFCGAIKSLQESFVYDNVETEKYPDTILRYKEDVEGNIEITSDGSGEPLTLSSSTVTLGELASWMSEFNKRKQKRSKEFRVDTLSKWLDFKINTYLEQADKTDREKIKAIFKRFHFLSDGVPDISSAKPLTPKEIGYLSPRVPRPAYVERPQVEKDEAKDVPETTVTEAKKYETRQVLLEDGTRILMKEVDEFRIDTKGKTPTIVRNGDKFIVNDEPFIFSGFVEDETSEYNGKPIGQLASGEEVYKVFSPEELDLGILNEFTVSIQETKTDSFGIFDFKQDFTDYWEEKGCKEKCEIVF